MTFTQHLNGGVTLTEMMKSFGPGCRLKDRKGREIKPVPIAVGRCTHGTIAPDACYDCGFDAGSFASGEFKMVPINNLELQFDKLSKSMGDSLNSFLGIPKKCPDCDQSDVGICFPCFSKVRNESTS